MKMWSDSRRNARLHAGNFVALFRGGVRYDSLSLWERVRVRVCAMPSTAQQNPRDRHPQPPHHVHQPRGQGGGIWCKRSIAQQSRRALARGRSHNSHCPHRYRAAAGFIAGAPFGRNAFPTIWPAFASRFA